MSIIRKPIAATLPLRDRRLHLAHDLTFSRHTALLYRQYRRHLEWRRYELLLRVQGLLVPEPVRRLLRLRRDAFLSAWPAVTHLWRRWGLRPLVRRLLIQPRYWGEVERLGGRVAE